MARSDAGLVGQDGGARQDGGEDAGPACETGETLCGTACITGSDCNHAVRADPPAAANVFVNGARFIELATGETDDVTGVRVADAVVAFHAVDATHLYIEVPPGVEGPADVTLQTAGGDAITRRALTYRRAPEGSSWTRKTMSTARGGFPAMTTTFDDRAFVGAGYTVPDVAACTDTADLFDRNTEMSTPAANTMSTARWTATATTVLDGTTIIAGGCYTPGCVYDATLIDRFDPTTNRFSPAAATMSVSRGFLRALRLADDRILYASDESPHFEIYDPGADTSTMVAGGVFSTSSPITGQMARLRDGRVLIVPGGGGAVSIFDPVALTFAPTGDALPQYPDALVTIGDGRVFAIGGVTAVPQAGYLALTTTDAIRRLRPGHGALRSVGADARHEPLRQHRRPRSRRDHLRDRGGFGHHPVERRMRQRQRRRRADLLELGRSRRPGHPLGRSGAEPARGEPVAPEHDPLRRLDHRGRWHAVRQPRRVLPQRLLPRGSPRVGGRGPIPSERARSRRREAPRRSAPPAQSAVRGRCRSACRARTGALGVVPEGLGLAGRLRVTLSCMAEPSPTLPRDALGVGLRPPHYPYLFEHWPDIDYLEVISENFLGPAHPPRERLDQARTRYPVVLHGVGLNLLGHAPLDEAYLDGLCRLADRIDAPFVTDHLCWTGAHGVGHHDLLPVPYVPELVELAAERADHVQRRLGRPFGIENLSSYVEMRRSTMSEWEFYTAVVREAGCFSLLDVNNIYVSSQNHGFDPDAYLAAVDFSRVLEVHVAGHAREPDGTLVDTHDHAPPDAVWALYARAWALGGPFPTLLEWDARIPPMPEVLAELGRAREARA